MSQGHTDLLCCMPGQAAETMHRQGRNACHTALTYSLVSGVVLLIISMLHDLIRQSSDPPDLLGKRFCATEAEVTSILALLAPTRPCGLCDLLVGRGRFRGEGAVPYVNPPRVDGGAGCPHVGLGVKGAGSRIASGGEPARSATVTMSPFLNCSTRRHHDFGGILPPRGHVSWLVFDGEGGARLRGWGRDGWSTA